MNEREQLTIERVDDIPILLAQLERMQVASLLDRYFPTHGNWQGLSLGQVVVVWLSHILSEGIIGSITSNPGRPRICTACKRVWDRRCAAWISAMTAWQPCWMT